jgi:hypothetical protein
VGSLSLHADNFGNFRFWGQTGLRNLELLPELLMTLQSAEVLGLTAEEPYKRMASEPEM